MIKNTFNVFIAPRKNVSQIRFLSWLVNLRLLSVRKAAIMIEEDEIKKQAHEKEPLDWRYAVPNGEVPLPPLCEPQISGANDLVLVTRSWESDNTFPLPLDGGEVR